MAKNLMTSEEILEAVNEAIENPRSTKVRTTIMLDGDVKNFFRKLANEKGTKYQTLINETLRTLMEAKQATPRRVESVRVQPDAFLKMVDVIETLSEGKSIPKSRFKELRNSVKWLRPTVSAKAKKRA
jgi:uncharacterized protein (DUF4415 family)